MIMSPEWQNACICRVRAFTHPGCHSALRLRGQALCRCTSTHASASACTSCVLHHVRMLSLTALHLRIFRLSQLSHPRVASPDLPSCLSFIIAFSLGHTLGISTKLFMYLRPLSRRILSYFNLHFTTRSRPGKSLITTAGEYFPESFNILRRSSPWSWPISTSRKPSGFRKSAAFSTMVL